MSLQYENQTEENEPQIKPEEYLQERKGAIRKRSFWAIGFGVLVIAFFLFALAAQIIEWRDLFRSILFIFGIFAIVGGIWGFYEARRLTFEDLVPTPEAIEFLQQSRNIKPYFSYILVGCLVAVSLFQLKTEMVESIFMIGEQSALVAGLVKPSVWKGEWWRILTSATLHGIFPLHIYLNAQALFGFGNLIEYLSNRVHLAIVFVLSIIGGGLLSLFFMPETISIGASGGIMGLIGYLAIYGYRRKQQLPPDFLKSMLINIGFIAAFGVLAYQIVDNFGHLGGLLTGTIYGFVQVPRDLHKNPRQVSTITKFFGLIALGIFITTSVFSILLLLKIV